MGRRSGKTSLTVCGCGRNAVSEEELAHWWKVFNDPVLDQLIDLTLKNNRQLEVARSRVRQGRLQLGIAEAQRLPWLDASVHGRLIEVRVNGIQTEKR